MARKSTSNQSQVAKITAEHGNNSNYALTSDFVPDFLRENAGEYYTASELAEFAYEMVPNFHDRVKDLPRQQAILQFARVISSYNASYDGLGVTVTASRPHKYIWTESLPKPADEETEKKLEKDLYPLLTTFCKSMEISTMQIIAQTSIHDYKNKNKWLHPDVVGYKDAAKNLTKEIKDLMRYCNYDRTLLYAFEVKRNTLKKAELKEAVLEAISNSSWANYSYLVAEDIEKAEEDELQLLCKSFKLGFISLNKENPNESEILVEATYKPLDWNMVNRIAEVNKDFAEYIKKVTLECEGYTNENGEKPKWDEGLIVTEETLFGKAANKTKTSKKPKSKSKKER